MTHSLTDIESLGLTIQRQAVLRVIRESDEHLTAIEVFENARQMLPGISFPTVYNSLRYLKETGLIAEISFGNGASHFDPLTSRHNHANCLKCGKLVDMEIELPPEVIILRRSFPNSKSNQSNLLCAVYAQNAVKNKLTLY
ncbi:MAG TPA: transcriptional repressor [Pyrinomonadaceae bacterium]|nr:transcriptional repressor [Pyrinomonadaceae bacterium]